jgi:hypothetical protein
METGDAPNAWIGTADPIANSQMWRTPPKRYLGNAFDKIWLGPKTPYFFEFTDPVAQIGYNRSVYPALTTNEALLNRAEAYIRLNQYDNAAADLEMWRKSMYYDTTNNGTPTGQVALTPTVIDNFYNGIGNAEKNPAPAYSTASFPSSKKVLHPKGFTIAPGTQENMIHCLLNARRIDFQGLGLRWQDIRRYGIEVIRYDNTNTVFVRDPGGRNVVVAVEGGYKPVGYLVHDDDRLAIQIPAEVRAAGLEANPRDRIGHVGDLN